MLAISAYVSLAILVAVYVLIIQRRRFENIPILTSMAMGALLMMLLQVITIEFAFAAINLVHRILLIPLYRQPPLLQPLIKQTLVLQFQKLLVTDTHS
jgi:hypothetical protein